MARVGSGIALVAAVEGVVVDVVERFEEGVEEGGVASPPAALAGVYPSAGAEVSGKP